MALRELAAANPAAADDPTAAGLSLCVRAPGDGEAVRRRERVSVIFRLVVGFAGLLAGAVCGKVSTAAKDGSPPLGLGENAWLAVGGVGSVGGILLMLQAPHAQRRRARRHIDRRLRLDGLKPPVVEVEETATFSTMKAVSEDVGLLLLYPPQRCVVVEGLTHRYVIYADDVLWARPVHGASNVGLGIQYMVGGGVRLPLDITIYQQSVWVELKRQTVGSGRSRLMEEVLAILRATTDVTAAAVR